MSFLQLLLLLFLLPLQLLLLLLLLLLFLGLLHGEKVLHLLLAVLLGVVDEGWSANGTWSTEGALACAELTLHHAEV